MTWSISTKRVRLDLEQPRQDLRDLHAGEPALAGRRVAQPDRDREGERRDVRERVARVDRERRQDREDLVEEALAEGVVVLGDRGVVDDLDALDGQLPPDVGVDRRQLVDEGEDPVAGGVELLLRRPAVGRVGGAADLRLLAQPGDPDLEELVEVAGEDGQELDPLEQRIALVACLEEHAGVELQPRELAIEVRALSTRRGGVRRGPDGERRAGESAGFDGGHSADGLLVLRIGPQAAPAGEDSTSR